ncbi:6250_t:CDS:2, partial [Diversispora eburnea]
KKFVEETTNNFEIREELKVENLKDNLKCMISSILDKLRKSIVMDRIVKEISDNDTIIITESSEIKELKSTTRDMTPYIMRSK